MSQIALTLLREKFGAGVLETHSDHGDDTAVVSPAIWAEVGRFLREQSELDFDMPVDLCAVDFPSRLPRFEVVLHLYSTSKKHRIRVKTRVGDEEGDGAEVETLTTVWSGVNWLERETFDMMGVTFRGHPDLRRLLLYPEFVGYPLRKDYPAEKTQPLIAYRDEESAGVPLGKQEPFGSDEGMSFGRKHWGRPDELS